MKSIISVLLVVALTASLSACGGTNGSSSGTEFSSSSEAAPDTATEAPVPLPDDLKEVLSRELEEVQNAVASVAPTSSMETPEDQEETVKRVESIIAELGLPVRQYYSDIPNYEKITAFFDKAGAAENAFFTVYTVTAGNGLVISGNLFYKNETGFFEIYGVIYQNESLSWEREISKTTPLKSLELTANGNLLYYENYENAEGFGYRVVPQQKEYTDAYWKYVWLVDVQANGVLANSWNREEGFRELPWEFIFEEIWERENKKTLIADDNPYYTKVQTDYGEDYTAVVPAGVVESTLQKHFDVDVALLREMTDPYGIGKGERLYNPDDGAYTIWGFRGGGYKPTVEVWGIRDNPDGSVSLDLAHVALDFGNDGQPYSTLTVMPQADGGFHYISNIFSENTIRDKVEYALTLAAGADMIHGGDIAVTAESVAEQNGYRFAAMDTEKTYQSGMRLGGLFNTDSIKSWFYVIFEKEAAEKYLRQIFEAPLYIDVTKNGEETLFVNQDIKGSPIVQGEWVMEDFAVKENTPNRITVQMRFDTDGGQKTRALTLVPGERRSWVLTDSYEGFQE